MVDPIAKWEISSCSRLFMQETFSNQSHLQFIAHHFKGDQIHFPLCLLANRAEPSISASLISCEMTTWFVPSKLVRNVWFRKCINTNNWPDILKMNFPKLSCYSYLFSSKKYTKSLTVKLFHTLVFYLFTAWIYWLSTLLNNNHLHGSGNVKVCI